MNFRHGSTDQDCYLNTYIQTYMYIYEAHAIRKSTILELNSRIITVKSSDKINNSKNLYSQKGTP